MNNIPNIGVPAEAGILSTKAKRRSLLPQFNSKTLGDFKDGTELKQDTTVNDLKETSEATRDSVEFKRRSGMEQERSAMPPPSKLSRPASMIPPRSSSHRVGMRPPKSYARNGSKNDDSDAEAARAASLAALTGSATVGDPITTTAEPGLTRSGSTRLPQNTRLSTLSTPAIPSRTTSSRIKGVSARTASDATTAEKAPTMTEVSTLSPKKARPSSRDMSKNDLTTSLQSSAGTSRPRPSSQMPQSASPPRSTAARSRPTSLLPPQASSKPSFTMYQQHYSPAKSALPKAPVPAARTSSKPLAPMDEETSTSFDVVKQQVELLQLSLLHQASAKCSREYDNSAKRKLNKLHTKLRKDYESIRATELVHQRLANLSALETWCPDQGLLIENLQILSLVYSDLSSLLEEGSRHSDVVSMFGLWMNTAEVAASGTFVQPLPEDWKAAHASVALKLRSIQRNLRVLPPVQPTADDSSLETILKACKALVEDMLRELEVMVKIEKEVLARERTRVEDEVKLLTVDETGTKSMWTPAWQQVA